MYFECQQDFPFLDDFISNSYLTHPLLKYSSTSRIVGPVFFTREKKNLFYLPSVKFHTSSSQLP